MQGKPQWGSEADDEVELDADKLADALKKAREATGQPVDLDDRKRKFNSLQDDGKEPTIEEMEAYRLTRHRADDPMAALRSGVKAGGESSYDMV